MSDKRGDLEIKYVIMMILGLIVLIVVGLIFYYGTTDLFGEFKGLYSEVVTDRPCFGANDTSCNTENTIDTSSSTTK
jgi:hypothetical protein